MVWLTATGMCLTTNLAEKTGHTFSRKLRRKVYRKCERKFMTYKKCKTVNCSLQSTSIPGLDLALYSARIKALFGGCA
jgi:hypothetical protein